MDKLSKHYGLLLGLDDSWQVHHVDLSLEEQRVVIQLEHCSDQPACCPDCGEQRPLKDHAPERTWRHLDTMQFETILTARLPRTECSQCGVKTIVVPWAAPHGRFTLMFEAFALHVLQAANNIQRARTLLGLSWGSVQRIMDNAVERGLERRQVDAVEQVGIDEKSFGKGHHYISVLTDIDGSRVLEVSEGRTEAAANVLWEALPTEQRKKVTAVAMDMWQAFESSATKQVPQADIVHDRFHISKYLNEAVDKVRRQEHKKLKQQDDDRLTGSKMSWLFNPENMSEERWSEFEKLKDQELKTSRAWAIKEQFRWFWEYQYAGQARNFFRQWHNWAARCRLQPVVKVAKMLKRRLDNILTWFRHRISNGPAEGFNSRIQSIKSAARGFKNFQNYRTRILFHCGKLQMLPTKS